MFTRAGFNHKFKTICVAMVSHTSGTWRRPRRAYLVRFVSSGEHAWLGAGGISWPEQVNIQSIIYISHRGARPHSRLPRGASLNCTEFS